MRTSLGAGPTLGELVRRAAGAPGLVALSGAWAGGTPVIASHPQVDLSGREPTAAMDQLSEIGRDNSGGDVIGGGWFGCLGFDGGDRLAFYDHLLRLVDGEWVFEQLWTPERAAEQTVRRAWWQALLRAPRPAAASWTLGPFAAPPMAEHLGAVERAIELIRAGELYQVNVCTRLVASFAGDPAALFADLIEALRPAYGAYLSGARPIISMSPELFLTRRGRQVESAPIKGTRPRGRSGGEDELRRSAKDTAENVMIVDLVRNDLGRVCQIGSVRPTALLEVQSHPGVWHLVSTVVGLLRPDVDDGELLRATFPPGSVTGAPKLRAIEAIAELETVRRGVYTGAIGFASPRGGTQFNVAIRTFEIAGGRVELGVGGGITADSVPMQEYRECLHKAAPLIRAAGAHVAPSVLAPEFAPRPEELAGGLLETVLVTDGVAVRAGDHLARLDRSARELYGRGIADDLGRRVRVAARDTAGRAVLRVVFDPDGSTAVSRSPADPEPAPREAVVVPREPGLWRHKWARRDWAVTAEAAAGPHVALFVASDGVVLETSRGNVFLVEPDGTLVTAPLRDDLLPGITRRAVLDWARDTGRRTALRGFDLVSLQRSAAFWTSSLRGAVPIHRVGTVALPRADALVARVTNALMGGNSTVR